MIYRFGISGPILLRSASEIRHAADVRLNLNMPRCIVSQSIGVDKNLVHGHCWVLHILVFSARILINNEKMRVDAESIPL